MKKTTNKILSLFASVCLCAIASSESIDELRGAVERSDWAAAKTLGEAFTEEYPENGEAFYFLGKALYGLKESEAAVAALKRANELEAENSDYLAEYAYALIQRGQEMNMFQAGPTFMRAVEQFRKAVKVDPDHLKSHIGLGHYYMNAPAIGGGSMKKAMDHAGEVARLNPFQGHVLKAKIAEKEKRFEDSESEYGAAIALKPKQAWLYFSLAKMQQKSGKTEAAKRSFEKVLELKPDHEGASTALASFES